MGFFPALLVLAGGVPTLAGLLGAPWLSATQYWLYWATTFDVLNNFLPIWAALLALGLGWALARRRTSRMFLAIASLLLLIALVPIGLELYRVPPRADSSLAADPERRIRLIQFNALYNNYDLAAALDLALGQDADVITVEEPSSFRQLEHLLHARYPYRTPCTRDGCEAIIYSRLPPLKAAYAKPDGDWYPKKGTPGNGAIGVASMTLQGPDGMPFTVAATHFRWPYPPMPVLHQRDVFLRDIAELDRSRAIVTGDFNLTPWTYEMRGIDRDILPMQRVTRALFSFPVPFTGTPLPIPLPILPIDHVYAGPRWQLVSARRGPVSGSDHYPVIVDLVMPEERTAS